MTGAGSETLQGASGLPPPSGEAQSRGELRASLPTWGMLPGYGRGTQDRTLGVQWQSQGLGLYLKAAIASMAWYRTAVHSWSTGSSSSSSCRAEMGWDLTLVSGARGAPVTPRPAPERRGTLRPTAEISAVPTVPLPTPASQGASPWVALPPPTTPSIVPSP